MRNAANTNNAAKTLRHTALILLPLLLAGCNETASDKLASDRIVLDGDLVVDGSQARMKVNLGKQGSTVVVVLQGGDTLRAGDGSTDLRMDYTSDLFSSYYRAAFPLNTAATYYVTLVRTDDGSSLRSDFPPIPNAFSVIAPVDNSVVSLGISPSLNVDWDVTIASSSLILDYTYDCAWDVIPLPPEFDAGPVEVGHSGYRDVTSAERTARRVTINAFAEVDLARAQLAAQYPDSTVSLQSCDVVYLLHAKNTAAVNAGLSGQGELSSRRVDGVSVMLSP